MTNFNLEELKAQLCDDIRQRVTDRIIEQTNADLLIKLISRAENETEAYNIAALGTTYKRTGFHFDKRLEKVSNDIKYKKRNDALSFGSTKRGLQFEDGTKRPKHQLIIGDNYDALQNLLITHKGNVDVIYIDPPYGKDNMGEFAQTNYDNAITRDNLLSMLYPRLLMAKRLLTDEGVIFCSIDDKNQAYVKCLFDEVFGESNFAAIFPWRKRTAKSDVPFGISQDYEYILCYAKSEYFKASIEGKERRYFETPDFPNRPWRFHEMTTQRTVKERPNSDFTLVNPKNGKEYPVNPLRCWAVTKDTFDEYYKKGKIIFPDDYDFLKIPNPVLRYWKEDDMAKAGDDFGKIAVSTKLPDDIGMSQDGTKEITSIFNDKRFNFPKPSSLIKYLLKISSSEDSVILDFFAGSGTTGQAVMELNREDGGNRTFILCTNNEVTEANPNGIAYDVTSKRLKRVMTGECYDGTKNFPWLKDHEPYGDGLEVYEIARVSKTETREGETAFDRIDERCYGMERFGSVVDKIMWVCENFENATRFVEGE